MAFISAKMAAVQLEAEIASTLPEFMTTSAPLPAELAGTIMTREPQTDDEERAHDPDERVGAESDEEGMASTLPAHKRPTTGEFASALRALDARDDADDFDPGDMGVDWGDDGQEAKPEYSSKAQIWMGTAGADEPDFLPPPTDFGESRERRSSLS